MNKNLSFAIEKAVEKINPKDKFPTSIDKTDKKPDLFSLSSETELFQNEKGIKILNKRKCLKYKIHILIL